MVTKELGKIEKLVIGFHDDRFGFHFTLTGPGWGVVTGLPDPQSAEFSTTENEAFVTLKKLLKDAKVSDTHELAGKPIEAKVENGRVLDWRILTEVL